MKIERRSRVSALAALVICALVLPLSGYGREDVPSGPPPEQSRSSVESRGEEPASEVVVHFDRQLDGYQPQKQEYNFYFTYKMVHPWWDAVALGIEDAAAQYEDMGVVIEYEYLAPDKASAQDQIRRLNEAAGFHIIEV